MALSRSDVAYLVSESFTQNDYGVYERTTQKNKVFVDVSSVNSQEWFEGGRNGLNPQYRFIMFVHDYNGEQIIEYKDIQYTVYRTYLRKGDLIELYTEKRKGNELTEEPDEQENS